MRWFVALLLLLLLATTTTVVSSQECPKPQDTDLVHLAGYAGDGYFTRAQHTLLNKLQLPNVKVHDLGTRHKYESWLQEFESTQAGRALHHRASTLIWLQDPLLVWGDSDDLEAYVEEGNVLSLREHMNRKQHDANTLWKRDRAQALVCSNNNGSLPLLEFHMVLNHDWVAGEEEQHSLLFDALVGSMDEDLAFDGVQANRNGWIKLVVKQQQQQSVAPPPATSKVIIKRELEAGLVLTNGTHVRVLTRRRVNVRDLCPGFVAVGHLPPRDVKRRAEQGWAESYACRFLPHGVSYVMNLDRLGEAAF